MNNSKSGYINLLALIAILAFVVVPAAAQSSAYGFADLLPRAPTIQPTTQSPPTIYPTAPVITITPTPTLTPTTQPAGGYERPVIVVKSYSISQDTISPGDAFTLYVTLYNAGQEYATNVVALFTPGELIPRDTGGLVAVGEIAPGNHREFGQPLVLDANIYSPVTSITMAVTYTDETGTSYTDSFTITLPVFYSYSYVATATATPTQSPTPSLKPQLVITGYTTDVDPLQPGAQFNLSINVQNVGTSTAKGVTMVVGGGSSSGGYSGTPEAGGISGTGGDFTNFAPIGSSNIQSLGDFEAGSTLAANQPLIVNVNTAPGAYPLKISFVYIDGQNHVLVDDQVITLLVYRLPQVDINFYQQVSSFFTGQPNMLPLQVVNLGRSSVVLGNMKVTAQTGQFMNNTILVGTLDPGGYFTLDASFIPDSAGPTDLLVSIDYTNDFNQPQVISRTITVDVIDQPIIEPPIDGGTNGNPDVIPPAPETLLQKIWRFILGLLGLDSGMPSTQPVYIPASEGVPTEQPIVVPAKPGLKGP